GLARFSPGSVHLLMLARDLGSEGIARYDLSPGHGYKDRYATRHETIHRFGVRFDWPGRVIADLSSRTLSGATVALARVGRTRKSAQSEARRLRDRVTSGRLWGSAEPEEEGRVVVLSLPARATAGSGDGLAVDRLEDLLEGDPSATARRSRRRALGLALHRLE